MGLLNRFFKSQESVAKDLELKDEEFLKIWQNYRKTVDEKGAIIGNISIMASPAVISGTKYQDLLPQLRGILTLELSDIEEEEKTEKELIGDLQSVEHDKRIQRVQRLYERLGYAETKYKYIYKLLNELHNALVAQLHIVEKLSSAKNPAELISHLRSQFAVEEEVLKQIDSRETFHELFLALVKGEHIVGRMDAKEKQLLKRMDVIMEKVFSQERKKGIRYQWAIKVFNGIQDQIGEYIARHEEDEVGNNPEIDFEYANHSEFIDFVKQCAAEVGETPSEQMVNVFVHVFREWYNQRE